MGGGVRACGVLPDRTPARRAHAHAHPDARAHESHARSNAHADPAAEWIARLDPEATARARVHDVENHGVEKIVTLAAGDTLLHLTTAASHKLQIDDTVAFSWNPEKILIFDRESGRNITAAA